VDRTSLDGLVTTVAGNAKRTGAIPAFPSIDQTRFSYQGAAEGYEIGLPLPLVMLVSRALPSRVKQLHRDLSASFVDRLDQPDEAR
jgi:hypothetical protein